jgi:hypothetical protein
VDSRFSQHGFTGTRGTVEQDTLGWRHSVLEELFGMLDRVLDSLLQFSLDVFETSNIAPFGGRDLDDSLSEGRGIVDSQGESEVLHGNTQRVEDLGVDSVFVKINEIHLFSNLLHGTFGTEGCDIGTDVTMSVGSNLLEVDIFGELHVFGVDSENLQSTGWVGDTNVDFSVESSESSESRVDRVGPVGSGHDDDVGSGLESIHQGKELRDDSSFNFTVGLVSLGSDGINLVDKDDCRTVLFGLFESFSKIGFRLSGHLGHDLGTVDQKEEGSGLVGDSSGHQGLSGTRRTKHEETSRGLDTNGLEETRVSEG